MIRIDDGLISLSRDGRRPLLVALTVRQGETAILLGRNGSGKTTILDVVAGHEQLLHGNLTVEPSGSPVAYVVQDANGGLLPWYSILSNVLLPSRMSSSAQSPTEQATALLKEHGLGDRRHDFPYRLSGGEKQLVNIIRALCTPSAIMLLDEPFSSLNPIARTAVKARLQADMAERTTILVTHDPADLDWPRARFLLIADSALIEVKVSEARKWFDNII